MLGHEIDIDPIDAALMAVRLAAGTTAFWRCQLADGYGKGEEPTLMQIEGYRRAVADLSRVSKNAIDAGVVETLVQITERMAEQLSLAAEEMLAALASAGVTLTTEQRTIAAGAYAAAVQRLEDEPRGGQATQLAA
jgi:hypothetical protein